MCIGKGAVTEYDGHVSNEAHGKERGNEDSLMGSTQLNDKGKRMEVNTCMRERC